MTRSGRLVAMTVAAGMIAATLTGRANLLVRPWFSWVLLGTGVVTIAAVLRTRIVMSRLAAGLLLLPVAIGVTLTPALASRGAQTSVRALPPGVRIGDGANPLLRGRGGRVTLLQILQAQQEVGGVLLAGRPVVVDAVVAGPHRLERSVIVCCAADAQSIAVDETGLPLGTPGRWVRVTGHLASAGTRTVIAATSVAPIATPSDPFL